MQIISNDILNACLRLTPAFWLRLHQLLNILAVLLIYLALIQLGILSKISSRKILESKRISINNTSSEKYNSSQNNRLIEKIVAGVVAALVKWVLNVPRKARYLKYMNNSEQQFKVTEVEPPQICILRNRILRTLEASLWHQEQLCHLPSEPSQIIIKSLDLHIRKLTKIKVIDLHLTN